MSSAPVAMETDAKEDDAKKPKKVVAKPKKDVIPDFQDQLSTVIPAARDLAAAQKLDQALEMLLSLEKQTRTAGSSSATAKVCTAIADVCFESNDLEALNSQIPLLFKRRGQLKMAQEALVQRCMTFLGKLIMEPKLRLIETLRLVTSGKIHVENERARLTSILAKIKEDEGKIDEAADLMQAIQVETFGTMDKIEKTSFILEQMRLNLARKDYTRTQIISKKINRKVLTEDGFVEMKHKFYEYMTQYHLHLNEFLDCARCWQAIYETPSVKADEAQLKEVLKNQCLYTVLAPSGNDQVDFLHRLAADKNLLFLDEYKQLLKFFLTKELLVWPTFLDMYREEFLRFPLFQDPEGARLKELNNRVVEHNIRVISAYYSRITMSRFVQLLDLPPEAAERHLSEMVVTKNVFARIDRPAGVINFLKTKEPASVLNDWSRNMSELLSLVETTCHMINKERMVHRVDQDGLLSEGTESVAVAMEAQ